VGKPPFLYPDNLETPTYTSFVNANLNRQKMVYAGANDGMLHGFDAATGEEEFAFIPGGVFANLHHLTDPNYLHHFYVDGTPTIGDVFYNSAWHTILVGGLNKGGKTIFALDVTDPSLFDDEANADRIFRWEFSDTELGYTYSRPAIVRMHNGKWAAVFGNGYNNSGNGKAYLYVVDIEDGTQIAKIDTGVGSSTTPNGLATPAVVDLNGDSIVDYVYAGDLQGNMWKFNVTNAAANNWAVAYTDVSNNPAPLFTALASNGTAQPITSKPEVGRGPRGVGMMIYFGTGKYMELADKAPSQRQAFYAVHDPNTLTAADRIPGRASLTQQTILAQTSVTIGARTIPIRVTSNTPMGLRGWYMDLVEPPTPPGTFRGEMQVSDSILRNGRIIFTTLIPDADLCSAGGSSWLMEMDALSGARLQETPFDLNNDGQFTSADFVTVTLADGSSLTTAISGLQSEVGIAQRPGILSGETAEYKYLSGSAQDAALSNIQRAVENPGPNARGRQSWRQIK
jgi:type IV pilus assembly protein PilY1